MGLDIVVGAVGVVLSYFLWRIERTITTLRKPEPKPLAAPPPPKTAKQRFQSSLSRPHMGVGAFSPTKGFK